MSHLLIVIKQCCVLVESCVVLFLTAFAPPQHRAIQIWHIALVLLFLFPDEFFVDGFRLEGRILDLLNVHSKGLDDFGVDVVWVAEFSCKSHGVIRWSNLKGGWPVAIELDKHLDGLIGLGLVLKFRVIAGLVVDEVFNEATAMIRHLKY